MIHATQDPLVQHVVLVTQLCLTLCNPMDCIQLGSSVHGILQVRILEWVAIPFSIYQLSHQGSLFLMYKHVK